MLRKRSYVAYALQGFMQHCKKHLFCWRLPGIQPLNRLTFAQELVCQERPLRGHLRAPRVPEECPEAVRVLMEACIEAEAPRLRPSAFEVFVRLANRWGTCCCTSL